MYHSVRNSTVLITGGAGFIGSHLAGALIDDNEVRILDDFSTGTRENLPTEASVFQGDIRDEDVIDPAMADVDVVFHEAAVVSVDESVADPRESHAINVDGTLAVLERARVEDARVVLASSAAIYGHPETTPIPETEQKKPLSPYGLDKLALDHYARQFHTLYGLETIALRYFNVYGPRQRASDYSGVISTFLNQAQADEPITIEGAGTQTRDFIHVDDIVRANLRAAVTDSIGASFNIGTGRATSITELASLIRDVTNSSSEITHVEPRPGDIDQSCADISKARDQLGFEPEVNLEDGLRTFL